MKFCTWAANASRSMLLGSPTTSERARGSGSTPSRTLSTPSPPLQPPPPLLTRRHHKHLAREVRLSPCLCMPKNSHTSDSNGHTQGMCNSTPEQTVPCRRTSMHQASNATSSKEASITSVRKTSSMSMKRRSRRTAPRP